MAGRCRPYCAIWRAELSYISGTARLRKLSASITATAAKCEEIWIFGGALCLYWCDVELHMYPIVVSGDSILGAKVSGFDLWRFILGAKVSVLISGDFHLERLFIWVSGRV